MNLHHLLSRALILGAIILSSLAGCGGGGGGSDTGTDDGLSNGACEAAGLQPRVIDGTECDSTNSPVVKITLLTSTANVQGCSGTMISAKHVLTAGHCFSSATQSAWIEQNGQRIDAVRYTRHPDFAQTESAIFNDVAILELENDTTLPTLPLMRSSTVVAGDVIKIFGYGQDENGDLGTLRSGEMRVNEVTVHHLIALFNGDGSNTCSGDSGGPALLIGASGVGVAGITSSGFKTDCSSGDTSLFANVQSDSYFNFIKSVVPQAKVL